MYVRFITSERIGTMQANYGLFQGSYDTRTNPHLPQWLLTQLDTEYAWFNDNLPFPKKTQRTTKKTHKEGICWFRGCAIDFVRHAHDLANLLRLADLSVVMLKTNNPGQILYEDFAQIVACPYKETPAT